MNDELQEALDSLKRYIEYRMVAYLSVEECSAILAHIESQDKRIAELESALHSIGFLASGLPEGSMGYDIEHGHPYRDEMIHRINNLLFGDDYSSRIVIP